ncbi:MAG TPA: FtsX-like permease family protein [Chitinophagaceae bacterium]|nr:FtsX-like permease family protein [Chitinophagaceae bacterium]
MLKSYFKVALRSFLKDKKYSIINMAGLAAGITTVFIIAAYIRYELSYDKYYSNNNRIYRLTTSTEKDGIKEEHVILPSALAVAMQKEIPGVEAVTAFSISANEFLLGNKPIKLNSLHVDSTFFSIFNLPLKYGNANYVLHTDKSVVISEDAARKYFAGQNPVGKSFNDVFSKDIYTITGVMYNIPGNTHFKADAVIFNSLTWRDKQLDLRGYSGVCQYIMLSRNTGIGDITKKLPAFYAKYNFPPGLTLHLQPVSSIHLHSNITDEPFANSSISYVYIFLFVALLILIIACVNYINLNTAKSLQRTKEIGVRKVLGAQKKQLSLQFTAESCLFFCSTIPVSVITAYLVWPWFSQIVNITVPRSYLLNINSLAAMFLITVTAGLLSGSYAAFFVSRLRPAHILKDWQKSIAVNMQIRKVLVVFQFSITVALIISTIIINGQLNLLNNMPLGFNKQNLIVLPSQNFGSSLPAFKSELLKNADITGVGVANWNAGQYYQGSASIQDPNDSTKNWKFSFLSVDMDFFKTLQIPMKAGRAFAAKYPADYPNFDSLLSDKSNGRKLTPDERNAILSTRSIIITHNVAEMMHLQAPLVGQALKYPILKGTIIGEVQDFLGTSLLQKAPAVIITASAGDEAYGSAYVRISPQNTAKTINHIHEVWKKFFPGRVFDFAFVDDKLNQLYSSQQRMASVFSTFAVLAIGIAMLGLFSLVALTVQQKTKEIGIRKVLGAGIADIIGLVSKGYLTLIFIAALIAIPVTWWAMNRWLQDFDYRVSIHYTTFIVVTVGCLLTALMCIVAQTMKVARANPVNSLRTE